MASTERRKLKRLRIDRSIRIQVQIYPLMPFIGEMVSAGLINLSEGGMALAIHKNDDRGEIKRGAKIKIHFRLPGGPLRECSGVVSHSLTVNETTHLIGLRFAKLPTGLNRLFARMVKDNDGCESRLRGMNQPWCDPLCSFRTLCRKPIRETEDEEIDFGRMEIALQAADQ